MRSSWLWVLVLSVFLACEGPMGATGSSGSGWGRQGRKETPARTPTCL